MVDEEIVVDKLQYINQYTNDLREMRGMAKDEYVADIVTQRAVERTFEMLIQARIDLAQHIRSAEGLSPSGTAKREIQALGNAGIVTEDTQTKLEEAVGFRNILAHQYGTVSHNIVYTVLHDDLEWFERFQQEIAIWFRDES